VTRVAVVVVTFERAPQLTRCLDGLAAQTQRPDAVFVVDNASGDDTAAVLAARTDLPLRVHRSPVNEGGAGGFCRGVALAYQAGFDRIWLMDDDVVAAPDCLAVLAAHPGPALMVVREDTRGRVVEKAALRFDLADPRSVRPKREAVEDRWQRREDMPAEVPVQNVAFEGFWVARRVVEAIGLPDPSFFIFYDDVDYALRARRAGFEILALRDARVVRQLEFSQQHDLSSWKGYYMYRNLFAIHFRYGENLAVRLKPVAITLAVVALSPWRGRLAEARNVTRALLGAVRMRAQPPRRLVPPSDQESRGGS
jgi:rhamnopyranosyl-N-acetylglucosaminyl-diphospho-decaprenol beta-1,3/1,4-galactofuranosyltransferase